MVEALEAELYPIIAGKIVNPLEIDFNDKMRNLAKNCVDNIEFEKMVKEVKASAVEAKDHQE